MIRKLFLNIGFLLLSFGSMDSFAQDSVIYRNEAPKKNPWENVFFGGWIGLQFGTVTLIDVSPLIGYHFNKRISAGVGITYQYYRYHDQFIDFETNVYGGRVFGRYNFTENFFGHVEYEWLNLQAYDANFPRRVDVISVLGGVGYMQRLGNRAAMMAMILYNFTETTYTPYSNPIFRVGVVVGL